MRHSKFTKSKYWQEVLRRYDDLVGTFLSEKGYNWILEETTGILVSDLFCEVLDRFWDDIQEYEESMGEYQSWTLIQVQIHYLVSS